MTYFENCKTAEELRKEFHRLAKELHPDNGGNAEDFKAMKAEFEKAWETVGNTYKNAEGETYQKKEQTMTAPEFESIIEKLFLLLFLKTPSWKYQAFLFLLNPKCISFNSAL